MTAYWKRFLISFGVVVGAFLPAMIRDFQNTVIAGPWLGVLFFMERFEVFRGLHLATPTWSVILGLLTPTVLAIASRWKAFAILATLFFLYEALFMYALMSADLGHALRTPSSPALHRPETGMPRALLIIFGDRSTGIQMVRSQCR